VIARRDWLIAAGFVLASFALCALWYWLPDRAYFDEVYYARAGVDYLTGRDPLEYSHPPLTKLLIALSILVFGGAAGGGDAPSGWRFLNVVIGALSVGVAYLFARRLINSRFFGALAALLLLLDGFHFTLSRVATPDITVGFFSMLTLFAFFELTQHRARSDVDDRTERARGSLPVPRRVVRLRVAIVAVGLVLGAGIGVVCAMRASSSDDARIASAVSMLVMSLFGAALAYLIARVATRRAGAWPDRTGWILLGLISLTAACVTASKWNGLLDVAIVWLVAAALTFGHGRMAGWRTVTGASATPLAVPFDLLVVTMTIVIGAVYLLSYVPFLALGHGLLDVISLQGKMFHYHATLKDANDYASVWWQWPLFLRPNLFYQQFYGNFTPLTGAFTPMNLFVAPGTCCLAEILALPNPLIWWLGVVAIPIVGWLAWRERNGGYALLVVAYLLHWLPWAASPRLAYEYHFYPNLVLIVIADAIVLQRLWNLGRSGAVWSRGAVGGYVLACAATFAFFYPVLIGTPISYTDWHQRMWFEGWIR
jgi:dolichyl-phosphate-mannose-protein mannosyltransferase